MSHILIVYGTGEGQTKKIANVMARSLNALGHLVTVVQGDHWHPPERADIYDGFMIGTSIHADHHQPYMLDWIKEHQADLSIKPSALFTVSLSAKADKASAEYEQAAQYLLDLMMETGWTPLLTASFAGALPFANMGMLKRYALWCLTWRGDRRYNMHQNYEYTDWDKVQSFVSAFGRILDPTVLDPSPADTAHKFADIDLGAWAI